MNRLTPAITDGLIRWRWPLLLIAVLAAAVSFGPAQRLDFDRTINTMFAEDDPLMPPYRKLQRLFGDSEVALAVYDDPELLKPDGTGIRRLTAIRRRLGDIPGVTSTMSLDSPIGEEVVNPDNQLAPRVREMFVNFTHGEDDRTVAIACILAPRDAAPIAREETVQRMRRVLTDLPDGLETGILAGEPVMMADAFRYVEQDGERLFWVATVLMGLIILGFFRSLRWVVIPIAVVQLALLTTKAILFYAHVRLTMVSSMLTAIVTVVGVATVVHVIVRFRDAREEGLEAAAALRQAGLLLVGPVFWACVTDAVGFASLMVASVAPVRNFGLMMATGSLMVLLAAALTIPGLTLLGRRDVDPRHAWGEGYMEKFLRGLTALVERHPLPVGLLAFVLAAAAITGVTWLETETDFTRNFREDTKIVRSYEAIESRLGGAGLCDVIVPVDIEHPKTIPWSELGRVMRFEKRLREEVSIEDPEDPSQEVPGLTKVISLADAIDGSSPFALASLRSRLRSSAIYHGMKELREGMPEFYDSLYAADPQQESQYYLRIMLRARERQPSAQKREILADIHRIKDEEFPDAEVTGYFVLLTHLIDSIVQDQWWTFAVAVVGIGLVMTIAFRSPRFALVALIPNCTPILIVSGLMGWLGLRVNMGAAMIAAVSVGLSVDSSIHYIRSFQRALAAGDSISEAIRAVQRTVGRAVIFSTLALILGFATLCTSPLIPTVYFGVLVSISMLGGLFGNLIVLPLLLAWVTPQSRVSGAPEAAA